VVEGVEGGAGDREGGGGGSSVSRMKKGLESVLNLLALGRKRSFMVWEAEVRLPLLMLCACYVHTHAHTHTLLCEPQNALPWLLLCLLGPCLLCFYRALLRMQCRICIQNWKAASVCKGSRACQISPDEKCLPNLRMLPSLHMRM